MARGSNLTDQDRAKGGRNSHSGGRGRSSQNGRSKSGQNRSNTSETQNSEGR